MGGSSCQGRNERGGGEQKRRQSGKDQHSSVWQREGWGMVPQETVRQPGQALDEESVLRGAKVRFSSSNPLLRQQQQL